jgi:hypothetical protein
MEMTLLVNEGTNNCLGVINPRFISDGTDFVTLVRFQSSSLPFGLLEFLVPNVRERIGPVRFASLRPFPFSVPSIRRFECNRDQPVSVARPRDNGATGLFSESVLFLRRGLALCRFCAETNRGILRKRRGLSCHHHLTSSRSPIISQKTPAAFPNEDTENFISMLASKLRVPLRFM